MIKYILWDIDNTLLDFKIAEYESMTSGFKNFNIPIDDNDAISKYNKINNGYWLRLENGEIDRDEVLHGRFREFFDLYDVVYDDKLIRDFNEYYQITLGSHIHFSPNAENTLKKVGQDYKQYAVTNGSKLAQSGKIKNSGLDKIFDGVFISEDIGFDKPDIRFFEKVFDEIGSNDKSEYIIIGDSLTSDMRGANNVGIRNIWYNPNNLENTKKVHVDYCIHDLDKVIGIIDDLNDR